MDTLKTDYSINFFKKESFLKKKIQTNTHSSCNFLKIINTARWNFFHKNKNAELIKFFSNIKNPHTYQKINFIFNTNLKKIILISRYTNLRLLKKRGIINILFLLNKLKKNANKYNYIFLRKKSPRKTSLLKALDIHQNVLKKANNDVKDGEYEDYLEKISSFVEKKKLTNNNKNLKKLDRLIKAVPKPLDEGRKYFLNSVFFLKSNLANSMYLRSLSRDSSFFFRNLNLMFFNNLLKTKNNLSVKTENFVIKLFRKKYMYYYSMVFLDENIIKTISPGVLLKFFEIYEKHKKKNKKALRLMIKTLARLFSKFDESVFYKIFIIEFFDKGIIEALGGIKNLSYKIHFLFINFKFCKEKRSFKKARLFKRNKVKKLLKINLDYIKSLNLKKRKEKYFNLLLK